VKKSENLSELTSNGIQKVHTCNALEDSFHNADTCIENDILEASGSLDPALNWNNITEEKVNPSSTSPALSDSWIMLDFNESNADDEYNRIVQDTEDFKQSFFESHKKPSNQGSIPPGTSLTEAERNQNLDKLLYSLISQQEHHKNQHRYNEFLPKSHQILKNSLSADNTNQKYPSLNENSFLGPIQRPKSNLSSHDFSLNQDLRIFNIDNQFYESNLKLTGEDIAMLSAMFSAKSEEMARSKMPGTEFNFNCQLQQKQALQKAKSADNRFQEFKLFDSSANDSVVTSEKSGFLLETGYNNMGSTEAGSSYWPTTNGLYNGSLVTEAKELKKKNLTSVAPWNSVLLNDFDDFAAPASLNNSSTGNHIKSLWATSMKESTVGEKNEKQAKTAKLKKK